MSTPEELMKKELKILFHALCDGLLQEVRSRYLASLASGQDFSLMNEREAGIASSLAGHLRLVGFNTQVESYFAKGSLKRRPDFRIWLPASRKYIYLELKLNAWGEDATYSNQGAVNDIKKLAGETGENKLNGLIVLGFSRPVEKRVQLTKRFEELSQNITNHYSYEEIGCRKVNLQGMDKQTSYAVIGLWFRKLVYNAIGESKRGEAPLPKFFPLP